MGWCGYDIVKPYLTAYDLAIRMGFKGTLVEWLKSLKGPKGEKGDPWTWEDYTDEMLDELNKKIYEFLLTVLGPEAEAVKETARHRAAIDAARLIRDDFLEKMDAVKDAWERAKGTIGYPIKIQDATWRIYNPSIKAYEDSGVTATARAGATGPEGPMGNPGPVQEALDKLGFQVNSEGHLIVTYGGDTPPDIRLVDGHLILNLT